MKMNYKEPPTTRRTNKNLNAPPETPQTNQEPPKYFFFKLTVKNQRKIHQEPPSTNIDCQKQLRNTKNHQNHTKKKQKKLSIP